MSLTPVVLALVPRHRAKTLSAALLPDFSVLWLEREAALGVAHTACPAAVVLDPMLLGGTAEQSEAALRRFARTVPIVFYTDLTLAAMHRVFDLRHVPGVCLVLAGIEDSPAAFRRTIVAAAAVAHRVRAAEELLAVAGDLPAEVCDGLRKLLAASSGPLTVQRLAQLMQVSPRTLARRLAAAGAPSARQLVRTGRALLARELLRTSHLTAEAIAHDVGYAKLESLRALTRWSFGSSPSHLRRMGS